MKDYKYYLDEGIYNFQCGKYSDAIENFNQSLELKNDWEIPYFYRAVANQALENFDDAILDYTKALEKDITGLKIGLPKEFFGEGINDEVKSAILNKVEELKNKGAIVEEFSMPSIDKALSIYYIISSAEASSNLSRYDGVKYGYRSNESSGINEMYENTRSEGFGPEVKRRIMLGTYVLSSGYYEAYYNKALKARTLVVNEFNKAFEKYDVIIGPTAPTTAFKLGEKVDNPLEMYLADICTVPVNIAGLPAISVPVGVDSKKMPIGIQIIAKAFDEVTLIKTAYNIEQ